MEGGTAQPFFPAVRYLLTRRERSEEDDDTLWDPSRRIVQDAAAGGVDWLVWRLVASKHVPDGLADIRQRWRFWDVVEAHMAIDALEAVEARARKQAEGS